MNRKIILFYIIVCIILFSACNTNDYRDDYQKDIPYDGLIPIDTVTMETYYASEEGGVLQKKELHNKTVKWYDLNGYHSMTKSWLYTDQGVTSTVERIIRDKYSLIVAKDISIEAPKTEPVVILSRLKKRHQGVEEWLYRNYFTAEKFIEDQSIIYYSPNNREIKKQDEGADSLLVLELDGFDEYNRLVYKYPGKLVAKQPFLSFEYGDNGYLKSSSTIYYENNDRSSEPILSFVETYTYELDSLGNQLKKYTYKNDSLVFITEYQYGFRK